MPTEAEPILTTTGTTNRKYATIGISHNDDERSQQSRRSLKTSLSTAFEDLSFSILKKIILAIIIYFIIAVIAFSWIFEKWTVIDSLYFGVVTFSTVGYGDLFPTTDVGRLFTIFFALPGIVTIGIALGIIGQQVVEAQERAMEAAKESGEKRVMALFSSEDDEEEEQETEQDTNKTRELPSASSAFWNGLISRLPLLGILVILAVLMGFYEKWSFIQSIYFLTITATTCGYGDMEPQTQLMRLFAILFIPLCVGVAGEILGRIAGFYMDREAQKAERQFLKRELTLADLEVMDADGDENVSPVEFLSFMLVAMQKVDKESVDELLNLFHKLDVDKSGTLSKHDLEIRQKKRKNKWKQSLAKVGMLTGKKSEDGLV